MAKNVSLPVNSRSLNAWTFFPFGLQPVASYIYVTKIEIPFHNYTARGCLGGFGYSNSPCCHEVAKDSHILVAQATSSTKISRAVGVSFMR